MSILEDFLNSPDGAAFGFEGDHRGWSTEETAVHFLKILAADSNIRFLEANFASAAVAINRQMDELQGRFNRLELHNESETR